MDRKSYQWQLTRRWYEKWNHGCYSMFPGCFTKHEMSDTLPRSVLKVGVAVSGMLMLMCVWTVLRQNSSWRLYDVSDDDDDDDDDDDVPVGDDGAALLTVRWQFSDICSSLCRVTENYSAHVTSIYHHHHHHHYWHSSKSQSFTSSICDGNLALLLLATKF